MRLGYGVMGGSFSYRGTRLGFETKRDGGGKATGGGTTGQL